MIDPHWQVIDLDPVTWRNLGEFAGLQQFFAAAQSGEHGLFILHDAGQVLKIVDTQTKDIPANIPPQISDPVKLARDLYARGQWQRVHIIDRRHLAWVAQQAQATPRHDLTLDAYYHLVYTLIWGSNAGYACEPPHPGHWHGWTYDDIHRFITGFSSPSALALGVYEDDTLAIGLILICDQGKIRKVTTFEALKWDASNPGPTQQTLTALCDALDMQFAPSAAVLLCTKTALTEWLEASDKSAYLASARADGAAIWHVRQDISVASLQD
jgi:hypothetical protein